MKGQHKRQFWVILTIVFIGFVGISMPYLIFPALFLNPEYTIVPAAWSDSYRAIFLGITLAAYPLGQFLGSPILGSLSDDYGRKGILSWSLVIGAFCNLLTGFAISWQHLGLLIASRFISGLMEGNIAVARAMAADITTISKHESFGKINASASIAYLLGPLIGGLLTDKSLFENLTLATPFYLVCLLFFCLAGLSSTVLEDARGKVEAKARSFLERINLVKRLSTLFKNQRLRFLLITSTCFTLAVDIFYEFGPVYLTVKWTLSPSQLVLYNGALCLALAVGNGWLPTFVSTRYSNRKAVIFCIGAFAVFMMGIVMNDTPIWMMLFFTFTGLVIGLGVTLLTVKISNSVSDAIQGEVMGVQMSLRVLGDAVICLFGGVFLIISSKLILIIAALMALMAMVYYANVK